MKKCKKCGRELPLEAFGNLSTSPDGKYDRCKECVNQQQKINRDQRKAKEQGISTENTNGEGNEALKGFTPRELLKELKSRGYIWENMYIKKKVPYESID